MERRQQRQRGHSRTGHHHIVPRSDFVLNLMDFMLKKMGGGGQLMVGSQEPRPRSSPSLVEPLAVRVLLAALVDGQQWVRKLMQKNDGFTQQVMDLS